MQVRVLREEGLQEALLGLSLSFGVQDKYLSGQKDMMRVAMNLVDKDTGENKYLESIAVWIDVTAPRYWWQEFDTYRIGVSKQSASTMHTLSKRPLTLDDFEGDAVPEPLIELLNDFVRQKDWLSLKRALPESFLQRRIVATNYKALRHIYWQRHDHRLPEWRNCFCPEVARGVKFPRLLGIGEEVFAQP